MYRNSIEYLRKWCKKPNRKPLIVRGARQVGKSYLVRELGNEFKNYLEINFEKNPEHASLFAATPAKTIGFLESQFNVKIVPQETLLFLDEIQNAPDVLPKLRYFFEEMPELHIIAAGSLLEFLLQEHNFSMPVGRLEYLYLGPMSFEEFLIANKQEGLCQWISHLKMDDEVPLALHEKALEWVRTFLIVGGMPEVVKHFSQSGDLNLCNEIKQSVLNTYEDDFAKYRAKVNVERLRKTYRKIPQLLGQKLVYTKIDVNERAKDLSLALDRLHQARICYKVHHTKASGLPLSAQVNEKVFKLIHLDVGLVTSALGLGLLDLHNSSDLNVIFQGALTEQFVGQQLLYAGLPYQQPELFYWVREKANAAAEVDFVVAHQGKIVPIEVKSGKTGRLRSLHVFANEKKTKLAVRINGDKPNIAKVNSALAGSHASFKLMSIPFYLTGQLLRLLSECSKILQ